MVVLPPAAAPPPPLFWPRAIVATVSVEPSIDWSVPIVPRRPAPAAPAVPWEAVDVEEDDPPPARALTPKKPPTARTTTPMAAGIIHLRRDPCCGRAYSGAPASP